MSKNSENPDFRRFFPCAARMLLEQTNTRPDLDVAQKLWLFHAFIGCLRSLLLSFSQSAKMSKMSFWRKVDFFRKYDKKSKIWHRRFFRCCLTTLVPTGPVWATSEGEGNIGVHPRHVHITRSGLPRSLRIRAEKPLFGQV